MKTSDILIKAQELIRDPERWTKGDYVLATKYRDGDPGDEFCVGIYECELPYPQETRHKSDELAKLIYDGTLDMRPLQTLTRFDIQDLLREFEVATEARVRDECEYAISRLRAIFTVNMLRFGPLGTSHAEIKALLDEAVSPPQGNVTSTEE